MATPGVTPLEMKRAPWPSTTKAFFTPGIFSTSSSLADFTLPPATGHWAKVAYSMPGRVTSMPKIGSPLTILGLSKPRTELPMILKVLGSFSVTVLRSGAGIEAAFSASWP